MSNRKYSVEFKNEAVKQVVKRGYSAREVSERIVVSMKVLDSGTRTERRG